MGLGIGKLGLGFVGGLLGGGGGTSLASPRTESGAIGGSGLFEIGTNKKIDNTQITNTLTKTTSNVSNFNREFTFQNVTGGSQATLDKTTSLRPSVQQVPSVSVVPSISSPSGSAVGQEGGSIQGLLVAGAIGVGAFLFFTRKKDGKK